MEEENKNMEVSEHTEVPADIPEEPKINLRKEIFEWVEAIVFAVVIAMIIRTFVFTLVQVQGSSMENTLFTGDRLFVYRLGYTPKQGDIVVFKPERIPSKHFIKRVIATEGQTVNITDDGKVLVDGKEIDQSYLSEYTNYFGEQRRNETEKQSVDYPITVPQGCFFAMGDNRINSHDCRSIDVGDYSNEIGCVSNKRLVGKALFRLFPFSSFGSLYK